ncbi:hypothetical protein ACLOJK_028451 [Asimina triloba]
MVDLPHHVIQIQKLLSDPPLDGTGIWQDARGFEDPKDGDDTSLPSGIPAIPSRLPILMGVEA